MEKTKTLEQIFWKEGKFVKKNGEEVKAEAIGNPKIIYNHERNSSYETLKIATLKLLNLQIKEKEYGNVNRYCLGEKAPNDRDLENDRNISIQFYKI